MGGGENDDLFRLLLRVTKDSALQGRYDVAVLPSFRLDEKNRLVFWDVSSVDAIKRALLAGDYYPGSFILLPEGHGLSGSPLDIRLTADVIDTPKGTVLGYGVSCTSDVALQSVSSSYRRFVAYSVGHLLGTLLFGCVEEKVDGRLNGKLVCHSCPVRTACRSSAAPFFVSGLIYGYARAVVNRVSDSNDPSIARAYASDFAEFLDALGKYSHYASFLMREGEESLVAHLKSILDL